ncbi:pectate lyase 1 [Fusarium agapanthi]|uniref:Pectate lyase 1 n=1 Tax=Fusarium agapanthi TaxID=1803897 RepID=A0A9P5E6D7_9HYPO|nr:pectate lyase 1 [Fusarium agapanthi]
MKRSALISLIPAFLAIASPVPQTSEPAGFMVSSGSCGAAEADEPVGYGAKTTGGSGDPVTLTGCDTMNAKSDTTILGVGSSSGLTDSGFRIKKADNVIIRNLAMKNPPKEMDLIDIETSTNIWIDHNEFSADGITGDKDFYDGLLDAKRGSDFLTFSWNKFSDHWKASLIGHSDSNGDQDTGKRMLLITTTTGVTCYEDLPTSGVNSRMGAQVLVETTAFVNVKRPIVTNLDSKEDGFAIEKESLFKNSEAQITQEKDFVPPYDYTTGSADCICDYLKEKAGTGVINV